THFPSGHYYPWPATFGAVLLVSLGTFGLEQHSFTNLGSRRWPLRVLLLAAFMLSMLPGFMALERAWTHYAPPTAEIGPKQFSLPAELKDESAWVWACEVSGTLWYYARKPAHKITS